MKTPNDRTTIEDIEEATRRLSGAPGRSASNE
jgi:hypothetical protein